MQNLTLVANSALGGNIVTILVRQLIMRKARQAAKAFKARISDLQQQSGEMDYQAPDVCIGVIPISTKKQFAYAYRAEVTQHAVETGAILTDHIILQPVRVDVSFEVTNWDLALPQQAHDMFIKLWQDRTPLELQTKHGMMENMILTNYQAETSVPNWGALECRASFTQLKFVNVQSIGKTEDQVTQTANTGGTDVKKSSSAEVRKGRQTPQTITEQALF
jgi:hypothetical protein